MILKHIDYLRKIRSSAIPKLGDENTTSTGSGGATDHAHDNKVLLDNLSSDTSNRLLISDVAINITLLQEDW